jgi:hypothetical protein
MSGVLKAKVGGVWVPIVGSGMSAEVARWNSAWGVVATGVGKGTTVTAPVNFYIDLTEVVSFTAVAGRRYRLSVRLASITGPAGGSAVAMAEGAGIIGDADQWFWVSGQFSGGWLQSYLVGDGLIHNVKAVLETSTAAAGSQTTYNAKGVVVEDVGPAIYNPAPPPVNTPTAWTDVTFQNGWANEGTGVQPAQYRRVGDRVELRGTATRSSALVAVMFKLPAGFCPPKLMRWSLGAMAAGVGGAYTVRADINIDGSVSASDIYPAGIGAPVIYLANIQFSTTP